MSDPSGSSGRKSAMRDRASCSSACSGGSRKRLAWLGVGVRVGVEVRVRVGVRVRVRSGACAHGSDEWCK